MGYIEYVQKMYELIELSKADAEIAHSMADDLLCEIIVDMSDGVSLRFSEANELIILYKQVNKYYA
jgi:hypothetical protein